MPAGSAGDRRQRPEAARKVARGAFGLGAPTRLLAIAVLSSIAACAAPAARSGETSQDEILFSHNAHARLTCGACHRASYDPAKPASDFRPSMSRCLECHPGWKGADQCGHCHTDARRAVPWRGEG